MQVHPALLKAAVDHRQAELRRQAERARAERPKRRHSSSAPVSAPGTLTIFARLRSSWETGEQC